MHIYRLPARVLNAHLSGRLIVGFIANVITTHMYVCVLPAHISNRHRRVPIVMSTCVCQCVCECGYTYKYLVLLHLTLSLSERHATATVCGDFGISFTVRKLKLKFAGAAPAKPIIQ